MQQILKYNKAELFSQQPPQPGYPKGISISQGSTPLLRYNSGSHSLNYEEYMRRHQNDIATLEQQISQEQTGQRAPNGGPNGALSGVPSGGSSLMKEEYFAKSRLAKNGAIYQSQPQLLLSTNNSALNSVGSANRANQYPQGPSVPPKRANLNQSIERENGIIAELRARENQSVERERQVRQPPKRAEQSEELKRAVETERLPPVPYSFKDLNVQRLPNDDDIAFEPVQNPLQDPSIDRFLEMINTDNDVVYLESSFPNFFAQALEDTLQNNLGRKSLLPEELKSQILISNERFVQLGQTGSTISRAPPQQQQLQQQQLYYNNSNAQNLISICFEDKYNNFQSMPKRYNKYQNPTYQLQLKALNNTNGNSGGLANKDLSFLPGSGPANNLPSELESKNPGTADLTEKSKSDDLNSKINSTFFNRKFSNVPAISKEVFLEELLRPSKQLVKIFVLTKYGVRIDVGFVGFRDDGKRKLLLDILYITRLYRKLHYWNFINLQVLSFLFESLKHIDRIQIIVNNKGQDYLKFLYQIGFKLEYVEGEKKRNKHIVLLLRKSNFQTILTEVQRRLIKQK